MNAGSVGPVSQPSADGAAGWLEHETAKACLDPIGQERVAVAADTAPFLLLDPHVQSHTLSPGTCTKGPRKQLKP